MGSVNNNIGPNNQPVQSTGRTIGTGPTAQTQQTTAQTTQHTAGSFQAAGARSRDKLPETGGLMGWIQRSFGLGGFARQGSEGNSVSGLAGLSGTPSRSAASETSTVGATSSTGAPTEDFASLGSRIQANQNVGFLELERGNVNQGLSAYLGQFKQALDANPGMAQELGKTEAGRGLLSALENASKGQIGTDDVLNIQKFIVASGVDIGSPDNPSGIDGQYGPKTHAGLQAAFEQFKSDPTLSSAALSTGYQRAQDGVRSLEASRDGGIDRYVPGKSEPLSASTGTIARPPATALGSRMVDSARAAAGELNSVGYCMRGVRTAFAKAGIPLTMPGGGNIPSAYMAADQLATRYRDQFTEKVPASREDLRNLPAGAVVVWDRNPDPAKRAANPNNGFSHGHIEIADGRGGAISDHVQRSGVTMNNNGRYGGFRIFLPNG